jgi:hypothetical protein
MMLVVTPDLFSFPDSNFITINKSKTEAKLENKLLLSQKTIITKWNT